MRERCKSGNLGIEEALDLFDQMLDSNTKPSTYSFNILLTAVARMKHHNHTLLSLHNRMYRVGGVFLDNVTYGVFIISYNRINRVDHGFGVFGSMLKRGLNGDTLIFGSLMHGLCKQKRVAEAAQVLDKMPLSGCTPSVVSHNTLIKGLCSKGIRARHLSCLRN